MADIWFPRRRPGQQAYQFNEGVLQQKEFRLSASDIHTLNSVPIPLRSAPGVGKVIQFESAVLFLNAGSVAHATASNLAFQLSDGAAAPTTVTVSDAVASAALITSASDVWSHCQVLSAEAALVANYQLEVFGSADQAATTGTSEIRGLVTYRIIDFSDEV